MGPAQALLGKAASSAVAPGTFAVLTVQGDRPCCRSWPRCRAVIWNGLGLISEFGAAQISRRVVGSVWHAAGCRKVRVDGRVLRGLACCP